MAWVKRKPKIEYQSSDSVLEKLAKIRGVEDYKEFFDPSPDSLHSPYLIKNMKEIAHRIIKAIHNGELIAVSSDVDTDGITSTAMMVRYLTKFTPNVYYTYHQRSKGHGIEYQMDSIKDGTKLLIILDSSTNSTEACKELSDKGIDVVILDHHEFEKENPYALIANPQLCDYPNKSLSGAGVTYKCLQVLDDTLGCLDVCADDFLDLVAVGMIADMMRMDVLENRYLVKQGLENIKNPGLQAILKVKNKYNKRVDTTMVSFSIAPLLNGTTRLDKIEMCLDLLLEDDDVKCLKLVKEMDQLKDQRREKENELMAVYEEDINEDSKIIIAKKTSDGQSTANYNGLIAQKLAQKYKRPALVLNEDKGVLKGSFRSYAGFKLKTLLDGFNIKLDDKVKKITEEIKEKKLQIGQMKRNGVDEKIIQEKEEELNDLIRKRKLWSKMKLHYNLGHEEAGGVALFNVGLTCLEKYFEQELQDVEFTQDTEYDLEINADDITFDMVEDIEKFDYITGQGFPKAKILVKNIFVEQRQVIGKNNDTVKFMSDNVECIKFLVDEEWGNDISPFDFINAIGGLSVNRFFNFKYRKMIETIQLQVDEYEKIC